MQVDHGVDHLLQLLGAGPVTGDKGVIELDKGFREGIRVAGDLRLRAKGQPAQHQLIDAKTSGEVSAADLHIVLKAV